MSNKVKLNLWDRRGRGLLTDKQVSVTIAHFGFEVSGGKLGDY